MKVNGTDVNTAPGFVYQAVHSQKVNLGLGVLSLLLAGGAVAVHFLHLNQSLLWATAGSGAACGVIGLGNAVRVNRKVLVLTETIPEETAVNGNPTGATHGVLQKQDFDKLLEHYPWVKTIRIVFSKEFYKAQTAFFLNTNAISSNFAKDHDASNDAKSRMDFLASNDPELVYVFRRK